MSPALEPAAPRPLRKDAERNRQRILQAAREVFAARGLDVTLDDIAHHADVGVATLYRRFSSRDELVQALFDDKLDNLAAWAQEGLQNPDPWAGLNGYFVKAIEAIAGNHGLRDVMFSRAYGQEQIDEKRRRLQPGADALIARCHAAGLLRPGVSGTDIAMIHYMMGAVLEYTEYTEPDLWRRYLATLLDGLRAAPGTGPLPHPAPAPETIDELAMNWKPPRRGTAGTR
ncbi:TetR/AcrR family transcriptional regulator [Actinoplanes awajinensis]|uniref:TetR/AcrR family transcriptional regulator n=1 Tax=Actinoplanes awajinensis TaxID=135946 RepID=UPI00082D94E1|nr:TetR/AcrR family transcriptional regulator [Actinoplanes awajinensis]